MNFWNNLCEMLWKKCFRYSLKESIQHFWKLSVLGFLEEFLKKFLKNILTRYTLPRGFFKRNFSFEIFLMIFSSKLRGFYKSPWKIFFKNPWEIFSGTRGRHFKWILGWNSPRVHERSIEKSVDFFLKQSLEKFAKKKKISGRKCGYISEETTNRIIKAMGDFP